MKVKEKILVTGSKGQLGSEIQLLSKKYPDFVWVFTDQEELDLCALEQLTSKLTRIQPSIILNCAAYTAVDRAEDEKELAAILNDKAVGIIAEWSFKNHCKLIHISTDYVFDGDSKTPLKETATPQPINTYGTTKRAGELACLENDPKAIIIRTSWVYSSFGVNFVKAMMRLMEERETLSIVNDQIGSPTYARDLAGVMLTIIQHPAWQSGIYHYSNEGAISWYEFSLAIKEIGTFDCAISGIPSEAYPTKAKRPKYSLLDKTKIKNTYMIEVPYYKESLEQCMALLKKKS